jgi:hypothetical protein
MGLLMPDDYQLPEGFVNPVPDPDAKKPMPWEGKSLPGSGRFSSEQIVKALVPIAVLLWVFSDALLGIADDQFREAFDSFKEWLESP